MKHFLTKLFLFSLGLNALAQTGLDVPQAGLMIDQSGALRAVTGFAQSFIAGAALRSDALSAACAGSLCLVKTATSVVASANANDPGIPAPPGPALFSIHGQGALVYFPAVQQFARIKDAQLEVLDWAVDGDVLSLRLTRQGPEFAVRHADGVWIISLDASIQAGLPPGTVAVLLLDGGIVYSVSNTLVIRRGDGSEISFNLPGVLSLSQLNESYAQVSTSGAVYALRVDLGREQLSVLPGSGVTQ
jgi:hypothetical protein